MPSEVPMRDNSNDPALVSTFLFLWRNKLIILLFSTLSLAISIVISFLLPVYYSSSSLLITITGNSNSSNLSNLASLAGIQIGGTNNIDPSEYLDKVVQDKEFIKQIIGRKWYYNSDSCSLDQILKIKKDTTKDNWRALKEKSLLDMIRSEGLINLSKDRRTGLLSLVVVMPEAQLAYDMNNFVIEILEKYLRTAAKSQAKNKREFIETRINEVSKELEKNENDLAYFRERNIAITAPQIRVEETRIARQVTLNQEVYIQLQKQFELAKIEELNDQPLVQIIKNPEIPIKKYKPDRIKICLFGIILGVVMGFAWAYLNSLFLKR